MTRVIQTDMEGVRWLRTQIDGHWREQDTYLIVVQEEGDCKELVVRGAFRPHLLPPRMQNAFWQLTVNSRGKVRVSRGEACDCMSRSSHAKELFNSAQSHFGS